MFICYICNYHVTTIYGYKVHLEAHRFHQELKIPLKCCQGRCKSIGTTVFNLIRHMKAFHRNDEDAVLTQAQPQVHQQFEDDDNDYDDLYDDFVHAVEDNNATNCIQDVKTEGVALLASLRANSSIPYNVIPSVVDSFNRVSSSIALHFSKEVQNSLSLAGVDGAVIKQVMDNLQEKTKQCDAPLAFLSSRFKIDKFFTSHPLFVLPKTVDFGSRFESHSGKSKMVYNSFQYVSISETLRCLLSNKSYVEALLQNRTRPDVISDFMDGTRYKEHYLFSDSSKLSLMLQLFYDDLGVTNPLRSHGSVHNVGVFYYTIKNLPQSYNSCFANVHLLALCYAHDISVYGFDAILDKFVHEINELSVNGIDGDFPIIGKCTIYASLCNVACDNLALNSLFGFIKSFSGSYFCTLCYATSEEIQMYYRAEHFVKRSIDEYRKDLSELQHAASHGKNHVRGVKSHCKLNEIKGFHVTDNYALDIMHIVLEGIVSVELNSILYVLCIVEKHLTLETVNARLSLLWGKITIEKTCKPAEITKLQDPGSGLVPSMKAAQYFALLKYLPLAIGSDIPIDNKYWEFLLHLSVMVDLIFAKQFTHDMVVYLEDVISQHLSTYLELFADFQIKLRPKHHLLVHLPSIILKSGPLCGMSCMRYELKNSFFKRCSHIVCNFTNIVKTLAHRHQQYSLYAQLSSIHIRSNLFTISRHRFVTVDSLDYKMAIIQKFTVAGTDEIATCTRLHVASTEYCCSHYVVVGIDEKTGLPIFGKIVSFVSVDDDDQWYIVVEQVVTDFYWSHFHAYKISCNNVVQYAVLDFQEILDHRPLFCHRMAVHEPRNEHVLLIRLPYHIF